MRQDKWFAMIIIALGDLLVMGMRMGGKARSGTRFNRRQNSSGGT